MVRTLDAWLLTTCTCALLGCSPEGDKGPAPVEIAGEEGAPTQTTKTAAKTDPAPPDTSPSGATFAEFDAAAHCDRPTPGMRSWCGVVAGWDAAQPAPPPAEARVFLGLTLRLEHESATLGLFPMLSVLTLSPGEGAGSPGRAKLTEVSRAQTPKVEVIKAGLFAVFKEEAAEVGVPPAFDETLRFWAQEGGEALRPDPKGHGWVFEHGREGRWADGVSQASLRRVGDRWVVVQALDNERGLFVSMFTDSPHAVAE